MDKFIIIFIFFSCSSFFGQAKSIDEFFKKGLEAKSDIFQKKLDNEMFIRLIISNKSKEFISLNPTLYKSSLAMQSGADENYIFSIAKINIYYLRNNIIFLKDSICFPYSGEIPPEGKVVLYLKISKFPPKGVYDIKLEYKSYPVSSSGTIGGFEEIIKKEGMLLIDEIKSFKVE